MPGTRSSGRTTSWPRLSPAGQARLEELVRRGWQLVEPGDADWRALGARPVGGFRLLLVHRPAGRTAGSHFQMFLVDRQGRMSKWPLLAGLRGTGSQPSYNWVEVAASRSQAAFPPEAGQPAERVALPRLDGVLLRRLAKLVPPGGHMMVEYESPARAETARGLALGVPPAATPLGALLFRLGFRAGFKDWYISEGGMEGPRKLQAYRPLDEAHARRRAEQLAQELRDFLIRPVSSPHAELLRAARRRARWLLRELWASIPHPAG